HQVRVRPRVERAGAEALDDLVQLRGQAADLALTHPLDTELAHHLVDPPSANAGQVQISDHGHQCPLRAPARLHKPRGVVAAPSPPPGPPAAAPPALTRERCAAPETRNSYTTCGDTKLRARQIEGRGSESPRA